MTHPLRDPMREKKWKRKKNCDKHASLDGLTLHSQLVKVNPRGTGKCLTIARQHHF